MCVIIHTPAGQQPVSRDIFDRASLYNPDGVGMAWVQNGKVQTTKRVRRFGRAYRQYTDLVTTGHDVLLHCRLGTSGPNDVSMVHPFPVSKDGSAVMAHNGVLMGMGDRELSDTAVFARALRHIPLEYWWRKPEVWPLLSEVMEGSKFAFLKADGEVWIPQRSLGVVQNGSWFSNSGPLNAWTYDKKYDLEWKGYKGTHTWRGSRFKDRKALPPARGQYRGTDYQESWSVDSAPVCIDCVNHFWKDAQLMWSTKPVCFICREPAGLDEIDAPWQDLQEGRNHD